MISGYFRRCELIDDLIRHIRSKCHVHSYLIKVIVREYQYQHF